MTSPEPKKVVSNCRSKRRHPNEITARATAMAHIESSRGSEKILWVYRCDQCGGWHLTKQPQVGVSAVTSDNPFEET